MRADKDIERRQLALDKRLIGLTYAEIASDLGVSRQRVQQWLSPPAAVRKLVYDRAGGRCQECGFKLNMGGHVHHTGGGVEDYNDIDNLQWLCVACHRRKHKGFNRYPAILQVFSLGQLRDMQRERRLNDKEFLEFLRVDEYTWNSFINEQGGNDNGTKANADGA